MDEDIRKLLREIELKLTAGDDVASACRSVGISDAAYSNWRRRFGAVAAVGDEEPGKRERATEELEGSEKAPVGRFPRTTVAERELDKLILKQSLNHLKPRVPLTGR